MSVFFKPQEIRKKRKSANSNIVQKTKGMNSPTITAKGNVNITYGISSEELNELQIPHRNKNKIIDILLEQLKNKNIALEDQAATIQVWVEKYNELKSVIEENVEIDIPNKLTIEKLNNGDIEGVEQILTASLQKSLNDINENKMIASSKAYWLGLVKELSLDYRGAINYYNQAVQLDRQNIYYLNKYGQILHKLGLSNKAIKYHYRALKSALNIYDDKHYLVVFCYQCLGNAYNGSGNFKKALKMYDEALKIVFEICGNDHPYTGPKYFGFARKTNGDKHPIIGSLYNDIGLAWADLGDSKKAIKYYDKALKIAADIFGENHSSVAALYNNIGLAWYDLGDYEKAIEYYGIALKIATEIYVGNHPNIATGYNNIGLAWEKYGDGQKAIEYYNKALKIFHNTYGNEHPYTKDIQSKIDNI